MGELVLLVVAAAWAAVLVPPLLRSRIENRPNSSVTDFRRQLNKLESTVPGRANVPMRSMARPLAQSPLRPVAGGRPGQTAAPIRRSPAARVHGGDPVERRNGANHDAPRYRSHSDASGAQPRPRQHASRAAADGFFDEGRRPARTGAPRPRPAGAHAARPSSTSNEELRRRRANALMMLVMVTIGSFFLAATTKADLFYYLFALSFLALFGFAFMLAQVRQRESHSWPSDWMHN